MLGFLIMPGKFDYRRTALAGNFTMIWIDLPTTTRPSVLYTQKQIDIGRRRMEEVGRRPPAQFTRKKVIGFFKTWHVWLLTPCTSFRAASVIFFGY